MRSVICYIPEEMPQNNLNFICSDNKVHIRFRDFDSPCVIAGFEQKLTYLISYLMNYSFTKSTLYMYDHNQLIEGFLKSKDVAEINACIRAESCNTKYKGIKLRKKYCKVHDDSYSAFGNVNLACFPIHTEESIVKTGDLNFFLSAFRISLRDYLFNDNYIIIIDEIKTSEINKKFINKMTKKAEITSRQNMDVVELW